MNDFQNELQRLNIGDFQANQAVPWDQSQYNIDQSRLCGGCVGFFPCFFCFGCFNCFRCGGRCGRCGGCGRCGRCGGR
ncbi:heterocycloanthracin/sonorensin family bacteriocin [Bacillus sp. CRN 9]|uniref:heterocycloanthracin/sonorensin family bacteriocin n=1 Tax=Cytobacillus horneckiae TaxID=549687 RepID=UPI0015620600|nr:heterocycloanthracin/sonorensin family bacteriocin [Bacillus sp. CRN 9]